MFTGAYHGLKQWVGVWLGGGDFDRSVAAVVVVRARVARFGLFEIGQAVGIRPIGQTVDFRPVIEIQRIATDVAHAVNQRRAAQTFAAPAVHHAVVHIRLRVGFVAPVVGGALQRHGQRGGHLRAKIQSVVGQARFQQQHARVGVLGQARGQYIARTAGANDDVVVFLSDF